jgi:chloride channel protein, CIC family
MRFSTAPLRRPQALWLSPRLWRRRITFWAGALAVGVVSVGFAKLATLAQALFDHATGISPWLALLITPLGFAASAYLCRRVFPGAQGSGIPQAIAARRFRDPETRNKLLSLRLAAGKVALTVLGLACGASVGREGPTVQVGASIMLQVARWGGTGRERGLILAGSAAGIAAAFNTPLAGIVFAIEEMSRTYEARTSGLVLTTVILAGLASLGIVGNYSYFGVTTASLSGFDDWLALAACGLGGGALGAVFSRLVLFGSARIARFTAKDPERRSLGVAAVCGLLVAAIGLVMQGDTYGTGYEQARGAVEGAALPPAFAPMKLLATLLSTLSGIPGGIFAPSLAVGAGIGSAVVHFLPGATPGAVVVLGMAGYFAGVVQAPITAFVIILEMTANHTMVIPLMIAAMLGYGVSRLLCPTPLYHALAEGFERRLAAERA